MKKLFTVLAIAVFVALPTTISFADGDPVSQKATSLVTVEPFDTTGSLFKMLGGLLFCLGIFGGGIHLLKRYGGQAHVGGKRRLKVIERVSLTTKTSLLLVTFDGKEMLVAAGPDRAQLIHSPAAADKEFEISLDRYSLPEEKEQVACAV
jgi:flagellar biogenesis protein FliO